MSNEKFKHAMIRTWEAIGHDVLSVSNENTVDKETVIEMVLDANRIDMYGGLNFEELNDFNELSFGQKFNIAKEAFEYDFYGI